MRLTSQPSSPIVNSNGASELPLMESPLLSLRVCCPCLLAPLLGAWIAWKKKLKSYIYLSVIVTLVVTIYFENELTLGTDRSFWIFLPLPHVTLGTSSLATFKIAECCRWKPALVATAALDMRRWRWCTSLWISLSSKISSPISSSITSSRVMTPTRCYNTMKIGIWHDSTKVPLLSEVSLYFILT